MLIHKEITLGELMTFSALTAYFTTSLTNIIKLQIKIQQARVANTRLSEVYVVLGELDQERGRIRLNNFDISLFEVNYR